MIPTIQPKQPETLGQFLRLLGRGFLRGLKWKLLLAAAVAFLSWIFHTYLLVVVNEGFNAGTNPTLDLILALSDRLPSAVLVWTLFTALFTALFWRMIRVGVGSTLRAIWGTPGWLWLAFRRAGLMSLGLLFVGSMMLGLLMATIFNQRLLSLQLALLGSGILVVRESSLLFMALSLGWSDLQRLVKRQSPTVLNLYGVGLVVCGVTLGFWLAVILPFYPYAHGVLVVLLLLGMIALLVGGVFRPGHFLLLIIFLTLALAATPALADDGGWSESGGTLSGWLTSEGAVRAIAQGLFPAMGAGLGVLLGAMAGSATTGLAGSPSISGLSGRSVPAGKMTKSTDQATAAPRPEHHQRHRPEPDLSSSQKAPPEQPAIARHEPAGVSASEKGESSGLAAGQKGEQPMITRHEQAGVSASQKGSESPQTLITRHETSPSAGQKAETPAMAEQSAAPPTPHHRAKPAEPSPSERIEEILHGDESSSSPPASHDPAGASQAKMAAPERMGQERGATGTPGRYGEGQSPHAQPIEPPPSPPPPPASQASQPEIGGSAKTAVEPELSAAGQAPRPGQMATGASKGATQASQPEIGGSAKLAVEPELSAAGQAPRPGQMATGASKGATQASQPEIGGSAKTTVEPELSAAGQAPRPGQMATGASKGATQASQPEIGGSAKLAVEPELSAAGQAPRPGQMATGASKGATQASRPEIGGSAKTTVEPELSAASSAPRPGEMGTGPTKGVPETPPTLVGGVPIIPPVFHWQITMTAGYATGQSFPLAQVTIIGRGRDSNIQLLDPKASRQHAQIQPQGSHCQISDLNSRNGTYVNGQRVSEPTPLHDGDLVRIGDTQFKLTLTS